MFFVTGKDAMDIMKTKAQEAKEKASEMEPHSRVKGSNRQRSERQDV